MARPVPVPRDDAMAAWMRDIKNRLAALAGRLVVPVGQRWRLEEDPEGNLVAVIPSTGHRILLGTPGGADCGALTTCLPNVTADPLRFDPAAQRLMLALSGQPGNRLAVAEDGGLFGSGGASLVQGWITAADPLTVAIDTVSYPADRVAEHTFAVGSRVWILVQDTTRLVIGTAIFRLPWHNGFDMGADGATISRYNSERGITGDRAVDPTTVSGPAVFAATNTDPISPLLSAYQPPFTVAAGAYPHGPDIGWSLQEEDSGGSPIYDPHWAGQWAEIYATFTLDTDLPSGGTWTLVRLYPAGKVWLTSAGQMWLEPAILGAGQGFNASGHAIVVPSFTAVPGTTYRLRARFARTGEATLKVWTDLAGGAAPAAEVATTIAGGIELGNNSSSDDAAANYGLYGPYDVPTDPPFGSLTTSYTAPGVFWDEIGVDVEPYSAGDIPAAPALPATLMHYSADSLGGSDGDLVTVLPDADTAGQDLLAIENNATYAPVLRTNALNGHNGIEFAVGYSSQHLGRITALGQPVLEITATSSAMTVFAVARYAVPGSGDLLELPTHPNVQLRSFGPDHALADNTAGRFERHYDAPPAATDQVHEWIYDGSQISYRRGGADMVPLDTTGPVASDPPPITYSSADYAIRLGFGFSGVLYELAVIDAALSGPALDSARAYFANQYGLPA